MPLRIYIVTFAALATTPIFAANAGIEHYCTVKYPSITQYFAWKDCVSTETRRELERKLKALQESEKRAREETARPCIAADITRMEDLAAKAKAAIKTDFRLEDAQEALAQLLGYRGVIDIPDDNIKERVLTYSIRTKCSSSFHFLINLRAAQDGTFRWYRTWAENSPKGYQGELHPEYSIEFERQRAQEENRAESARRDAALQEMLEKTRREREEQRQKLLHAIKISGARIVCGNTGGACTLPTLKFTVTNVTAAPVKQISFGWMLPPPQMTACPTNLATKNTLRQILQPGEAANHEIFLFGSGSVANVDSRFCLKVTDIEMPRSWER